MNEKLRRGLFLIFFLSALLFGAAMFSLSIGADKIPLKTVFSFFSLPRGGTDHTILFYIRLPRIILAIAAGGGLSIAGVLFQGMFRNPLVEPYTLGVSGGAALGVTLTILLGITAFNILGGFLGALFTITLVYFLTARRAILKIHTLLLTGVMISFLSSSLITLIMAVVDVSQLHGILFWIMGSLEETNWFLVKLILILSLLGFVASYLFSHSLNALSLGEEEASHLGVDIEKMKRFLFVLASALTGCIVSVTGIIGFVGLVIPHFIRMIVGRDHRIVLPASFLGGGIFLLICDTLARTIISPLELPVGVVTGIVGGVLFIYFLSKRQTL